MPPHKASAKLGEPVFIDPTQNPEKANADVAAVLDAATKADFPVLADPPPDLVELPGGLVKGDELIRTATVRELTGEHEETLARAMAALNPFHYVDTLLACGTTGIGDETTPAGIKKLLRELLVGDRDALVLGIRRATYGDSIELPDWQCPECGEAEDLEVTLHDIETRTLDDPRTDTTFEVPLRKGGNALVRLANGGDYVSIFENLKWTTAERDTRLLTRCVIELRDAQGSARSVQLEPGLARTMSIPDRRAVMKELAERQPGPRYNDIRFTHNACGNEVSLQIAVGDLFPL